MLGSNVGDRLKNILSALELLLKIEAQRFKILDFSSVYETEPEGVTGNHPFYLNMAVLCETDFLPRELLQITTEIEKKMGRKNKGDLKPRVIDIDILLFGELIIHSSSLRIPHPQIMERKFVLHILKDLSKDFVHPEYGKTFSELLSAQKEKNPPILYLSKTQLTHLSQS